MGRLCNIILGKPPIAGIEYILDNKYPRVLKPEDISNGIVRIQYDHVADDYISYRTFHLNWRPTKTIDNRDKWKGK